MADPIARTAGPGTGDLIPRERRTSWRLRQLNGVGQIVFPWNLIWNQRHVLVTLVRSQIARRHRRSLLGWGWNLIQPGSQALLLFAATRAAIRIPDAGSPAAGFGTFFAAFILAQGMGEIIGRGPTLVTERSAWVKGSLFPLELLAPTAVGVALYRIVPGGLLGVTIVLGGAGPDAAAHTLTGFAAGLVLAVIWGTTLAMALSALGVYVRDAILAAPILTLAVIFVSPLYVPADTGGLLGLALYANPLTVPMNLALHGLEWIAGNPAHFALGLVLSLMCLWAAAAAFRRVAPSFADFV